MKKVEANPGGDGAIAAVDLGSNSFHMVIAREEHGALRMVDRVKEMVRLGEGLDEEGLLAAPVQQRALECLERFGQRLREIPPDRVRAVGTKTLRDAGTRGGFLRRAEKALGHVISIISGHEEARLIYLGAAHSLAQSGDQRLVVDIGGGSTELIIGSSMEPFEMTSLDMGCVSMTRRHMKKEKITAKSLRRAETAALQELEPVMQRFRQIGWTEAVGTSGTIRAILEVMQELDPGVTAITPRGLARIREWMLEQGRAKRLALVANRRRPVFAGGFAVLAAVFDALNIDAMRVADGALREGVLYDLAGRLHDEDSREGGVNAMLSRFGIDQAHAARVESTALDLLLQVAGAWHLLDSRMKKMLSWAARLHEVGTAIAWHQHHRHGAYILENANLTGFSRQQQRVLGAVVRAQRQKFQREAFDGLPEQWRSGATRLAILLRLSITLNRGRTELPLPAIGIRVQGDEIVLSPPAGWLEDHPLTEADLETERQHLEKGGFVLRLESGDQRRPDT